MNLLYIEDSASLRRTVAAGLRAEGFRVDVAADGREGLWRCESQDYDVVILDLMLPGIDGRQVLRKMRQQQDRTPVLILSARDQVTDRVEGLDGGADDYLTKPFAFAELLARVRVLVRRRFALDEDRIIAGELEYDLRTAKAKARGVPLDLAPRELGLLELLLLKRGQVVSRSAIEARIYDERVQPLSNVVEASISILRRALREAGVSPPLIVTVRGRGYTIETRAA